MTDVTHDVDEAAEKRKPGREAGRVYVLRAADGRPSGLTPDGLKLLKQFATHGKSLGYAATKFAITKSQMKKLMGPADEANEIRITWECGFTTYEDKLTKWAERHAEKNPVALMYLTKVKLEWKDNAPAPPSVENKIQIVLPASQTREEYFKTLGIEAPLDYRSARAKAEHAEVDHENRMMLALPSPGVIDVTPIPESQEPEEPEEPRFVSRTMASYLKSQGQWREGFDIIDEEAGK